MPKDRQYVVEFFSIDEVKNNKAPLYISRFLAVNLKDAKRRAQEAVEDNGIVIVSVMPDKGLPISKRKRKHTLTTSDIKKVEKIYAAFDAAYAHDLGVDGAEPTSYDVGATEAACVEDNAYEVRPWEPLDEVLEVPMVAEPEAEPGCGDGEPQDCEKQPDAAEPCLETFPAEAAPCEPPPGTQLAPESNPCRCGYGIDDDGDGNCSVCTSTWYKLARNFTQAAFVTEVEEADGAEPTFYDVEDITSGYEQETAEVKVLKERVAQLQAQLTEIAASEIPAPGEVGSPLPVSIPVFLLGMLLGAGLLGSAAYYLGVVR